jgi:DNA-binding NarL/FixJ family response regulator
MTSAIRAGLLAVHPEVLAQPAVATPPPRSGLALTSREGEILELAKLGARSRTEAVTLALRAGLLAV